MSLSKKLAQFRRELFHLKHELMTELIYHIPGMLPDRYVLILTNQCNLRCPFCYQKKGPQDDQMCYEDWSRVLDQLPSYARVTLTGGEPLMFPEFRALFSDIARRWDCNLITNGLLLSEETSDLLLGHPRFKVLSVSIDDFKNKVRGLSERQWEQCQAQLKTFIQKRNALRSQCVFEVKATILDQNAPYLFDLYRYCVEELDCDHFSFQFLKGSPLQHSDVMSPMESILDPASAEIYKRFEAIQAQLEMVRQYNLRNRRTAFLHPKIASLNSGHPLADIQFLNKETHAPSTFHACKFPWSSIHINSDGEVFPCLAVAMGNIKTTPLKAIIQGKAFRHFREIIRREGTVAACNRCGWLRPR
jgi:MoaA/NifB/PqqE/SkfB family radical SAM enzyme